MLEATRSEIAVPLIVQDRVMGVLDVQSNRLDAFGDDDQLTLETLAGQLALAIQEAETYDAERRQTERINAMTEVARALVSILDIDDLLDEVVDLVNGYLGYDRVHLFLRVGDRLVFRSGSGVHSGRWALEKLSYDINATTASSRAWPATASPPSAAMSSTTTEILHRPRRRRYPQRNDRPDPHGARIPRRVRYPEHAAERLHRG